MMLLTELSCPNRSRRTWKYRPFNPASKPAAFVNRFSAAMMSFGVSVRKSSLHPAARTARPSVQTAAARRRRLIVCWSERDIDPSRDGALERDRALVGELGVEPRPLRPRLQVAAVHVDARRAGAEAARE